MLCLRSHTLREMLFLLLSLVYVKLELANFRRRSLQKKIKVQTMTKRLERANCELRSIEECRPR